MVGVELQANPASPWTIGLEFWCVFVRPLKGSG